MNLTITLERRGVFEVQTSGDRSNKCGSDPNENHVRYNAKITVPGTALDAQGFIIAHENIHELMQNLVGPRDAFPSCEVLSFMAAHAIAGVVPNASHISVTIASGSNMDAPMVGMTCDWKLDPKPATTRPLGARSHLTRIK
jgi:hypothetical protein